MKKTAQKKSKRPDAEPAARARAAAQRLLARREHSRAELARKLAQRGFDAELAAQTVDQMVAGGWLDEARFAESVARHRWGQGRGPKWVRAELAQHGLDEALIAHALDADLDWAEAARRALRRLNTVEPARIRQKLYQRGFDADLCRQALTQAAMAPDLSDR